MLLRRGRLFCLEGRIWTLCVFVVFKRRCRTYYWARGRLGRLENAVERCREWCGFSVVLEVDEEWKSANKLNLHNNNY